MPSVSRGHLFNKILALAIFDGPTQSGFDQLSQEHWGWGYPPPLGAIPECVVCLSMCVSESVCLFVCGGGVSVCVYLWSQNNSM